VSGFLIDTNVVSEIIRPAPSAKVIQWLRSTDENLLHVSVLTIGEIRQGVVLQPSARHRAELEAFLDSHVRFRFAGRIIPISGGIADRWGRLTATCRAMGAPLPPIDGLMAATALHHDLILSTRNTRHVASTGVQVFNPWEA